MNKFSHVLVTGGAGFIGSHLACRLLATGYNVTVLDNLQSGRIENIAKCLNIGRFKLVKGDIRDGRVVKDAMNGVDAVVHLAALINVEESVINPLETHDVNVNGSLTVLNEAVRQCVRKFLLASSTAVYGEENSLPLRENYPVKPISPYAASKAAVENYCEAFHRCYRLPTVILRYFNVYGPRSECNSYSGVITKFVNNALSHEPIVVFGDGEQTRDFIFIEDVVNATVLALESDSSIGEVLNVCTGGPTSVNTLVQNLKEILASELQVISHEPRKGDVSANYGDPTKTKKIIGFEAETSLIEGLKKVINFKRNELDSVSVE
jgi:UDP-glucose 4-epimerase